MAANNTNQSVQQQRSSTAARKQSQQQQMSTTHGGAVQSSNVRSARERDASPSPSLREQQQQHQQRQRYVRTQSMPIVAGTQQTHSDDFDFDDSQQAPNSSAQSQQGYPRPVPVSRVTQPQFRGTGGGQGQGQLEKWQMTDDLQADIDRADLLQQQQQVSGQRQQSHSPAGIVDVRGMAMSVALPTTITIPPPGTQPAPGTAGVAYAGGAASAGVAFVSAASTGGSSGHSKSHSATGISPVVGDILDSPGSQASAAARRRTVAAEQAVHRASPLSYALRKAANSSPGYPGGGMSMPSPRSLKNRTPDRSLPVQEEPDEHEQHQQQHGQAHQRQQGPGSGRVTPSPAPSSDLNPTKDLDHDGEGTLVDLGDDDDEQDDQPGKKLKDGLRSAGGGGGGANGGSGPGGQESTEGEGSHTPRSPTNSLYPHSHGAHAHGLIHQQHSQHNHRGIHELLQPDKMHANGGGGTHVSTTSSGSYSNSSAAFDPQEFQQTLKKIQHLPSSSPYPTYPPHAPTSTHPPAVPPPPFSPFSRAEFSRNESRGSYPTWMFDFYHNYPASTAPGEEGMGGEAYYEYDAAAEAFMQQFLPPGSGPTYRAPSSVGGPGGPGGYGAMGSGTGMSGSSGRNGYGHARPDAPIPPTPHSQTSAPTPFRRSHQQQQERQGREQNGVENEDNIQNDNDNENEDNEEVVNGAVERQHDRSRSRDRDVNENEQGLAQNGQSQERFVPPFSPAPPSGTPYPYPYPFSHVRRVGGYVYPRGTHPSHVPAPPPSVPIPGAVPPRVPSSMYNYDPNAVQEQLRLQMQMYAYNNYNNDNGAMTDSTFSTTSTPYPGMAPGYTPFGAYLNQSRKIARARERERERAVNAAYNGGVPDDGRLTVASMRSSPSHLPVSLPPMPMLNGTTRWKRRDQLGDLREEKMVNGVGTKLKPPPRVDSTQPRDTTPEPISEVDDEDEEDSGEETAGEKYEHEHREHVIPSITTPSNYVVYPPSRQGYGYPYGYPRQRGIVRDDDVEENGGEWVDEESDEEEDLLDLEFHPSYVTNPDRRRRRWEKRWEDLVRAFQALDRETDTTLLLLASPSHTNKLYSLSSRSIRRDNQLGEGNEMHTAKGAFGGIAAKRRKERREGRMSSLIERLYLAEAGNGVEIGNIGGGSGGGGGPQSQSERSQSGVDGDDDAPPEGEGVDNVGPTSNDSIPSVPQQSHPPSTTSSTTPLHNNNNHPDQTQHLRRLLRTTLHSLSALQRMYEEREGRWRAEERRMREEREGVDLLLRQAFGVGVNGVGGMGGGGGMGEGGLGWS